MRYDGKVQDNVFYRVYAKFFNRDGSFDTAGRDIQDHLKSLRGGFRIDWTASHQNAVTFHGDIYSGDFGQELTVASLLPPFVLTLDRESDFSGGNLFARWTHTFMEASETTIQFYYDRSERAGDLREVQNTFDLDFQHNFRLGSGHDFMWGLGIRGTSDNLDGSFVISTEDESRTDKLVSGFIHDEITLSQDRLKLTFGSKFEHNDYSGFEVQPNARIRWSLRQRHSLWAAISRAVKIPSRFDHDFRINASVFPRVRRHTHTSCYIWRQGFRV